MIDLLRAELEPLSDRLQDAGSRGISNLRKLPYGGLQWQLRAFQRDPFLVAIRDTLPAEFGTFRRLDALLAQRRLVYHSDALNIDLVLRRRGSTAAYASTRPLTHQFSMFPDLIGGSAKSVRKAAIIWDVPQMDRKHQMVGPMPVVTKLARDGAALDDNDWEGGFSLTPRNEDLIPTAATYSPDQEDWDVDSNEHEAE